MESTNALKKTDRMQALINWLQQVSGEKIANLEFVAGDASFRRYYRMKTANETFIVMDAPPPLENCVPFIAIADALRGLGLKTPVIHAADTVNGFLLLSDFGDATYLKTLNTENADDLYAQALKALSILQSTPSVSHHTVPPFTAAFMRQEWAWHKEWFLGKLLGLTLGSLENTLDACFEKLVESATHQPQVFMHRDFHSANLMVLPNGEAGILDFQDAFIGPVTYDLVSLLRDCYIDWPDSRVQQWVMTYYHLLKQRDLLSGIDETTFKRWFDYMGLERHLKALFTFARKHVRDHQSSYLAHVPRTLNYIQTVSALYPELSAMTDYYRTIVPSAFEKVRTSCAL